MKLKKITAIFNELRLKPVEDALIQHGITGFTLDNVCGRGRYYNTFNPEQLIKHVQMDIYTVEAHEQKVIDLIVNTAHVDADSEGLVTSVSVDKLVWIHDRRPANSHDFQFREVAHD